MTIKRSILVAALIAATFAAGSLQAKTAPSSSPSRSTPSSTPAGSSNTLASNAAAASAAAFSPSAMNQLPAFNPAPMLAQSTVPADLESLLAAFEGAGGSAAGEQVGGLRQSLIKLAMRLRDIRYVRGGHDPSTGFDCSGFVRYVFAHAVGLELPSNSASQFLAGLKVRRSQMQAGDLVFFRTAGRHGNGRVSHVGIYLDNGRFIHSPSHGKSVEVSSLDETYWAQRFAGARRPGGIAQNG
ncbi:C40 family peptidase [Frateuria defendens]|uniref:C40 family peptidase n=1 Tax=Frateuria defendens TaxID=2219559 RepID=UPI00066FEEC7|nr:C40 family peptidase [Frateuria defendens]